MFMFMFHSANVWYNNNAGWTRNSDGSLKARVWWRISDGEWALFKDMISSNQTFVNWIKSKFSSKKYVYCMYDSYLGEI